MAKRPNDDPEPDQVPADEIRPAHPIIAAATKPKAEQLEGGETTRVLLTGDNRHVLTERYVPTDEFGFRINVEGQFYEHVGEGEGGVWIFAPTR